MTFDTIQSKATVVAATPGASYDSSVITGDYMIVIRVRDLHSTNLTSTPVPQAVFSIESSVNAFGASVVRKVFELNGAILDANQSMECKFSVPGREMKNAPVGTAVDLLRVNLSSLTANTSCEYEAFVIR